jgi:hypothetical protein
MINKKIALCCFIAAAAISIIITSCANTSRDATNSQFSHLVFTVGGCGDLNGTFRGQGVIDLRNGNEWCVPHDGSAPRYEGTLNLAAIPEQAPSGQ